MRHPWVVCLHHGGGGAATGPNSELSKCARRSSLSAFHCPVAGFGGFDGGMMLHGGALCMGAHWGLRVGPSRMPVFLHDVAAHQGS